MIRRDILFEKIPGAIGTHEFEPNSRAFFIGLDIEFRQIEVAYFGLLGNGDTRSINAANVQVVAPAQILQHVPPYWSPSSLWAVKKESR